MADNPNTRLLNNIHRLLTPQPCLSLHVFALDNRMLESVRRRLLWQLDVMVRQFLQGFPGVEIKDAFLCGSLASYFWKDDSDFDIWLQIKIDRRRFFIKNQAKAEKFLNKHLKAQRDKNNRLFTIDGRILDVKISASLLKQLYGVYSITTDRWVTVPRPDLTMGLNAAELYAATETRCAEILQQMDSFTCSSEDDAKKITDYYDAIILRQYESVFEYMVMKLLRYEGITVKLRDFCADRLAGFFSIQAPSQKD